MSSGSSSKAKRFKDSILHRSGSQSSSFTSVSVKDNAKAAWHGFKLVSKNVEKFLDGTPFKIPVGILNTLIGIADAVIDNRESMAILLLPIGQRLEIVSLGLETKRRPSGIDFTCERFSRVLAETVEDLGQMNEQGLLKRILASNEHPKQLDDIFRRVDEATKNFELELTLAIVREVEGIVQHTEILRLRDLRPSREARYADVQHDPCVQGTREEIIESVMCWCKDPSSDCPPIYWLSGMAGTGKSTIAYTICQELYNTGDASHRLGASFFCSRQIEAARLRKNVIPTIAHDLAHSFPPFGRALLASKFDVIPPPLKHHIQSLLSDPWRSVTANPTLPPLIVVIDALDELEQGEGSVFLEQLINEIAGHREGFRGLKFLITSRQDPRIVDICAHIDSSAVCRLEQVPFAIAERDIKVYLRASLPDLEDIQLSTLAHQASGLFIYAATAVRFIIPPFRPRPTVQAQRKRLDILINGWPRSSQCTSANSQMSKGVYRGLNVSKVV